ncbi:hypothetical protein BDQ12DRAFT_729419 [Crucibulum laeve]|uniref:NodB homology domain-containing protein n=1 Tax=Crucibulum laeve TaxID=68775 RepID=A0A5C3LER6_9AGAR|nr:hypothetical protein BDQ12DRAFT_729419 [Crucibulum laeve]
MHPPFLTLSIHISLRPASRVLLKEPIEASPTHLRRLFDGRRRGIHPGPPHCIHSSAHPLTCYPVFILSLAALGFSTPYNEKQQLAPVVASCTVPNTVALTFDDGPYQYMKNIVDLLNANNAAGTFFLNGNNYGCIYDIDNTNNISYAYNHGHQIASHTWAHRDLTLLTKDEINIEMELTEDALAKITGATPAFTRPPYGNHNNIVVEVAGSRGQSLVIWDFDTEDSEGAPVDKQKSSIDDLIARHPQSILSLEHEVYGLSILV